MAAVDIGLFKVTWQLTELYGANADGDAYWRNLANTIKPSMCGSDAAFCQITLTTCYYYYYSYDLKFTVKHCC